MLFVKRSPLLRYGVATLAVALVLLLKLLLDPLITEQSPFLLLAGAVMVSAWFGGLGPGLVATALSALAADYFFLPPHGSFTGPGLQALPLVLFALQGLVISWLTDSLHSARGRAEESTLEAQRHQEQLRRSEERFRLMVEGVKDYAVFMLDPQGRIATWNEGAQRIKGYSSEEIIGEHFSRFYTQEDLERGHPEEELQVAVEEGRYEEEGIRVRKDGSRFWASVVITALRDKEGNLRGFSKVTRNITERKRAERALRESEERYRVVAETASDAIVMIDEDSRILFINSAAEKIFGHTRVQMLGQPLTMLMPERLREVHEASLERYLDTGRRHLDWTFVRLPGLHKSGKEIPLEISFSEFVRDGKRFFTGFVRDVTERKRAEEALKQSEQLYRSVVEQAAENIFLVDARTKRILEANAAFHRSLGYPPEELKEMTLYDIVAHDRESIDRNAERIMREGHRYLGERKYRRKDGSLVDVEVNASVISYGGKDTLCVVAHDVTERKWAEQRLRDTLDRLLALYEAGQVLGSTLEREEIGSGLLETVERVSDVSAAVVDLPDERGRWRVLRSTGPEKLWRWARSTPEALAARRAALESEGYRSFELEPQEADGARLSGLCLPLRAHERIIGMLEAYGPQALVERGTVETLASLANQAASALENARLYGELAEHERQLQELVGKLVTAQEEERRRVAYEVHDGLAQTAAAAYQHLQNAMADLSSRDQEGLDQALVLIRHTVEEARSVVADLRPTVLDDFGLATALRLQVERLRSEDLQVSYEESLEGKRLPAAVETALFRVAQEALTNVRKHAQTERVRVALERRGQTVRLRVWDWGRGFSPSGVTDGAGPGEKVGLSSMRERVALLGGRFEIHSEPGAGTLVVSEIPLREEIEGEGEVDRGE